MIHFTIEKPVFESDSESSGEEDDNEPVDIVNSPINTPDNNIEQIGVAGDGTEKEDDQESTVSKSSNLVVGEEDTKEDEKDGQVDQPMVE